jgi:hypothetical protein
MFARLLAAFCLMVVVVSTSASRFEENALVVYLAGEELQPERPLEHMKTEFARLMDSAGYRVVWAGARHRDPVSTDSELIVINFRGVCGAAEPGPISAPGTALASTAINGTHVMPFSSVDCSALTAILARGLGMEPGARRDFLYGRAMARLIAHEMYHFLLQTRDHELEGIARPRFSARDLLSERFDFEPTTLERLRTPAGERTASPAVPSRPGTPRTSMAPVETGSGS